ncbi:hypothetical protein GOP47_0020101 [Adiantum capillus-veneris]|uniref:GTPase Era n=1 Tax=Adiantum capillus-veneris TaxID=13818 RepID=A0A9D4UCC8_ADICA|nr:hypothetical protein GOP47_0020101 [Adiantum capillus-veneris]
MAREALRRHEIFEMQGFMPLTMSSSALSSSSSSCFSPSSFRRDYTEKWEPNEERNKAVDNVRHVLCRAGTSSSVSSAAPFGFKLSTSSEIHKLQEKQQPSWSCENIGQAAPGRFGSCRVEASPSSPSSSAESFSSLVSLSSDAPQSDSSELPSVSKRSRPVFVLSDKPHRALQQQSRPPERGKPKRRFEDKDEDDHGLSLTTTVRDHRSGYVALIGKPNVGKSTLMNRMIGQKLSIVTNKPQTTRHRILGICSGPEYQMILYDTPGMIAKRMNKLDEMMMQNVRTAALNADCVLVIVDAAQEPQKFTEGLEEGALKIAQSRPSLLVMNKRDVIKPGEIAKKIQWYEEFSGLKEVLAVSAKYGHGVEELKSWLVSKLPLGPAYYPKEDVSDQPEKFFASEIIREKIFLQYMKEIPYVSQVNVLTYIERIPPAKDFIEVEIVVERESQKAIMIGKEGSALKTLATASRLDIEDFVGRAVYLEIKVKVKEDWRANENLLKYYGYGGQLSPEPAFTCKDMNTT